MLTSTICAEHPSCVPPPPIMMFSEKNQSSTSVVRRSVSSIISYILSSLVFTWHIHETILVALNYGRHKSTFTFFEVLKLPAWISHVVIYDDFFCLSFDASLTITIVKLLQLSNRIWTFLHFAFPLQVFIEPCSIVE